MAIVTAPTLTPESIFQLAQGFMASKVFFVANEIGLFEHLADGPKSADEVAANLPHWQGLAGSVRNDGEKDTILDFSQEDQAIFSAGVEAASAGGAMALASSYDFGRHRGLLDIGGGTGSFLKIIGRQYPHLELTLFELPKTAAFARSRFTPNDAARIKIVEGDVLNRELLPTGFDALLLSHVIHCFNVDENRVVLEAAYDAASAGGRLLIVEFFLEDTKTAPVACTLMSAEFLMNTRGIAYSMTEVRHLAEQLGWRFVEHRALAGPVSLMVLEK
jgi:SAM-dependent methyltransferase